MHVGLINLCCWELTVLNCALDGTCRNGACSSAVSTIVLDASEASVASARHEREINNCVVAVAIVKIGNTPHAAVHPKSIRDHVFCEGSQMQFPGLRSR
jgi:hypothetical protein